MSFLGEKLQYKILYLMQSSSMKGTLLKAGLPEAEHQFALKKIH